MLDFKEESFEREVVKIEVVLDIVWYRDFLV